MISIAKEVSHDEVLEITKSLLSTLFKSDSLLSDLPSDIILEEILSQVHYISLTFLNIKISSNTYINEIQHLLHIKIMTLLVLDVMRISTNH